MKLAACTHETAGQQLHQLSVRRPVQLYVSKTKRKAATELHLPAEVQQLLTHDHLAASLHAVHLRDTSMKRMHRILRHYRRRYSTLVAFVPSDMTGGHLGLQVALPCLACIQGVGADMPEPCGCVHSSNAISPAGSGQALARTFGTVSPCKASGGWISVKG